MTKQGLIILVGLTLVTALTIGSVLTLTGDGPATHVEGSESQGIPEPSGDQPLVTSIDDIDPNECNWVHNITACEGEVPGLDGNSGIADGELHPDNGESFGVPASSAICVEDVHDCTDMLLVGHDEEGVIEPDFGEDVLYLVPSPDIECSSDQAVSITSDGQVSCGDWEPTEEVNDSAVSPDMLPAVEPAP